MFLHYPELIYALRIKTQDKNEPEEADAQHEKMYVYI